MCCVFVIIDGHQTGTILGTVCASSCFPPAIVLAVFAVIPNAKLSVWTGELSHQILYCCISWNKVLPMKSHRQMKQ